MLIDKYINVPIAGANISYYKKLGYNNLKIFSKHKIKVDDLNKRSTLKVKVKCDKCGIENIIQARTYFRINREGLTYCHSCANKLSLEEKYGSNYIKYGKLYSQYVRNAKKTNKEFKLSIDEFNMITSKPCHYCGEYNNLDLKQNGIDRINSKKGYVKLNCVPCCKKCNYAKSDLTYNEFINHIIKIHDHIRINHVN